MVNFKSCIIYVDIIAIRLHIDYILHKVQDYIKYKIETIFSFGASNQDKGLIP